MKARIQKGAIFAPFRKFRWRLTLSYSMVTLAALFILGWWGLVAGAIYLQRANPGFTWPQVIFEQLLPALKVILPSAAILVVPAILVSAYFGFLNARWLDIRLERLRKATQAWQQGDFSVRIEDEVPDEIGSFGLELNGMAGELERLLRERGDLAGLEERNRLARDLHDSVKQQITAASFQIGAASALLEKDLQGARSCLSQAESLAHQAHQELNSIIFELRPVGLKAGGLAASLRAYVEGWGKQNPVAVHTRFQGEWNPELDLQEDLLRFVQEGLSNVARHSQATQVEVRWVVGEREITLSIQDNGQGFEGFPHEEGGYGLKTIRERIEAAGGTFPFESRAGQGTVISATIPQNREPDGEDA